MSSSNLNDVVAQFQQHYSKTLGNLQVNTKEAEGKHRIRLEGDLLKPDNGPRILHHGQPTQDVLMITHGLSDSPWYVSHIAEQFFNRGVNVLMPLLPGHGLIDPDDAMEDKKLDTKWKADFDEVIKIAGQLGNRLSVGGFSTGGALSYNKILRDPSAVNGGLFLFSGAIDLTIVTDFGWSNLLQGITKLTDGKISGVGRDPYKYPKFPNFAAMEVGQITRENNDLSKGKKIDQPVFSAHSANDDSAKIGGIIDLLNEHVETGQAFVIGQDVAHAEVPLAVDVPLDTTQTEGAETPPRANPQFDLMMENALRFFEKEVMK